MVFAQGAIPDQHIPHRVILPFQRVHGRHPGQAAEVLFGEDADHLSGNRLRVQLLGAFELIAFLFGRRTETLVADDEHRGPRVDVVGGGAAEARDERARVFAAERAEFSCENDELSREWLNTRQAMRG